MTLSLRPIAILTMAGFALAACDPAEFDPDPDVRAEARGNRKCLSAVKGQTSAESVLPNTTLPVVEFNQFLVDVPSQKSTWVCITDDEGNPQQLYQLGTG